MLLEAPTNKDNRIKCGNSACGAEYTPKQETSEQKADFSCPVCSRGKFDESYRTQGKQILHG